MVKNKQQILKDTENYIRSVFEKEGSGHDWWHIHRVRKMALKIAEDEGGDVFLIEMAALLHDLDDWKLSQNEESKTRYWLLKNDLQPDVVSLIAEITEQVSFKGAGENTRPSSLEAQIVQDADRLDAIGAIGIARTFAYGGNRERLIYLPDIKPEFHADFQSYKKNNSPTINHFYEKLLLLKDRLNTPVACKIAERRHRFMEDFLNEFFMEWETKI